MSSKHIYKQILFTLFQPVDSIKANLFTNLATSLIEDKALKLKMNSFHASAYSGVFTRQ